MSRLTDKITSYTLERGLMLDENYTITPTQTGSFSTSTWTLTNTAPTNVDGPMPGQKGWRFTQSATTNTSTRFRTSGSEKTVGDNDNYSVGVWIKFNSWPTANAATSTIFVLRPITSNQGFYVAPLVDLNTGSPTYNQRGIIAYAGGTTYTVYSDTRFVTGKWYYFALRRDGSSAYFYINGDLENTWTGLSASTTTGTFFDIGNITGYSSWTYDVAGIYLTGFSDVDATAVANIWDYGSPWQATIKHWDGSTWATATGIKVYRNSQWEDVWASRWDGSAWIPL